MKIHTIDLNFQDNAEIIASYLIVGPQGPLLVESGPGSTLPTLIRKLAEFGYQPADIKHLLVTHIHLDHAGSAGWWAQQGAHLYVHHVGAPHLIDPSRLLSSAGRIYGARMDTLWGEVLPAPAGQVTPLHDGQTFSAAGLSFTALDTPGHAWHHLVYRLGDTAFTGDALGIQVPGTGFVDIPAPPPEFNLEKWRETLALLKEQPFQNVYPTHFGRLEDWRAHLETFTLLLDEVAEFVRQRLVAGLERDAIVKQYRAWRHKTATVAHLSDEDFERYDVVNPLYMSVDGLLRFWNKRLAKR